MFLLICRINWAFLYQRSEITNINYLYDGPFALDYIFHFLVTKTILTEQMCKDSVHGLGENVLSVPAKQNHIYSYLTIHPNTGTYTQIHIHKYSHTHTHTRIYIYIYIERERERGGSERERCKRSQNAGSSQKNPCSWSVFIL